MWKNWQPWNNTEPYTVYYNTAQQIDNLDSLAEKFDCTKIEYETFEKNTYGIVAYQGLSDGTNHYWLNFLNGIWSFYYPKDVAILKFKWNNGGEIRVDFIKQEVTTLNYYALDFKIEISVTNDANIMIVKPDKEKTSFATNSGYTWSFPGREFGIDDGNQPYYWTTNENSSWTTDKLDFSSVVQYTKILTEDNSDPGDAVLLPEDNDASGSDQYLKDDKGYCYIIDNQGNIVYNKLLKNLARKVKINNGYRMNGNQSLELISFNSNIKNDYTKQPGQYYFGGDKVQKYGNKENSNQTSQEQNIPYFGGTPAIYPVLIYSNMDLFDATPVAFNFENNTINKSENGTVTQIAKVEENDIVIIYTRPLADVECCTSPYLNETVPSSTNPTLDNNGHLKLNGFYFTDVNFAQIYRGEVEYRVYPKPIELFNWQQSEEWIRVNNSKKLDRQFWYQILTDNQANYFSKIIVKDTVNIGATYEYAINGTSKNVSSGNYPRAYFVCSGNYEYIEQEGNKNNSVNKKNSPLITFKVSFETPVESLGLQIHSYPFVLESLETDVFCLSDQTQPTREGGFIFNPKLYFYPGLFPSSISYFKEEEDTSYQGSYVHWITGANNVKTYILSGSNASENARSFTTNNNCNYYYYNQPNGNHTQLIGRAYCSNENAGLEGFAIVVWKNGKLLENS